MKFQVDDTVFVRRTAKEHTVKEAHPVQTGAKENDKSEPWYKLDNDVCYWEHEVEGTDE